MLVPTRRMLALRAVAYPSHRACRAQPAWVAATRRLCTADAPLQLEDGDEEGEFALRKIVLLGYPFVIKSEPLRIEEKFQSHG